MSIWKDVCKLSSVVYSYIFLSILETFFGVTFMLLGKYWLHANSCNYVPFEIQLGTYKMRFIFFMKFEKIISESYSSQ